MGSSDAISILTGIVRDKKSGVLDTWVADQKRTQTDVSVDDLRRQAHRILDDIVRLPTDDWNDPACADLKSHLRDLSRAYALRRATPSATAAFVLGLKDALYAPLRAVVTDPQELWEISLAIHRLIDRMGLYTFETFVNSREEIISEQQQSISELSTPVVELWDRILALPIIGTVDSLRTQQIMESLLEKIVASGAQVVLMDITGVPIVDTTVAKHLLQTVAAARLLGAEVILVGISPRIAQTLVHLGVELGDVTTRATLARGLELALARTRQKVVPL